jgi:hypothetical protein
MFASLDFVYMPSRDVAADVKHHTERLGATLEFTIERFGTRVAMVRTSPEGPSILFAGHLHGDQPVLVYRVDDLDETVAELRQRGVDVSGQFEIPHGPVVELSNPGPQRVALYELTRPDRVAQLAGRRDF